MGRIQTLIPNKQQPGAIIGVNPKRLQELPYYLLTNQPHNEVVVAGSLASPMRVMMISGEGPGQLVSFAHEKTQDMKVFLQIQDGSSMRGLMNGSVHIDTIAGTGAQPYYLPEALYIDEKRALLATFTNITTEEGSIRFVARTKRLLSPSADPGLVFVRQRMENRQYLSNTYWYTLDEGAVTLAQGETLNTTITVGQQHHFDIFKLSRVSTGRFNIDIVDTARGESIISGPLDVHYPIGDEILFGTGNFPFTLHEPRMVEVGQKLLVTLVNRHNDDNTIYLTLGGRAVKIQMWR